MKKKRMLILLILLVLLFCFAENAYAAGDVSSAIQQTWTAAQSQVKTLVENVVFPVIDMILAVLFFVKLGTAYFDYRKHGQFEFTAPCILFACLLFTLPRRYISGIFSDNSNLSVDFPSKIRYPVANQKQKGRRP